MPQPISPAAAWVHRNWNELRGLNFQWVAATGEGLFASDADLRALMVRVSELGLQDAVAYAFIDFDEDLGQVGEADRA